MPNELLCQSMPHASELWLYLITGLYYLFAAQVLYQTNWRKANHKSVMALGSLIVVFLFCATSGYASSLLPPEWWQFREYLHMILAVAAGLLVVSNQAAVVSRLLEHE